MPICSNVCLHVQQKLLPGQMPGAGGGLTMPVGPALPPGVPRGGGGVGAGGGPSSTQQQQHLMQQMIQSVHGAVQLGLLPPDIVSPLTLSNANFVINVQHLIQLYQMHARLTAQLHSAPSTGSATQQLSDMTNTVQQQMQHQRAVLLQMAASGVGGMTPGTLTLPPPLPPHLAPPPVIGPPGAPPPSIDQLLKTLASLSTRNDDVSAVSRLNSWTVPGGGAEGASAGLGVENEALAGSKPADNGQPTADTGSGWGDSGATEHSQDLSTMTAVSSSSVAGLGGSNLQTSLRSAVDSSGGAPATSAPTTSSTTAPSSSATLAAAAAAAAAALEIEEFIPGKTVFFFVLSYCRSLAGDLSFSINPWSFRS